MTELLIDSDVILDLHFDRMPFSQDSDKLFSLIEMNKLKGFVTSVIVANVYYMIRKYSSHKNAIDKLDKLLSIMEVIAVDKRILLNAIDSNFTDFEDAIQNFSAVNSKSIEVIITRNIRDYRQSELSVMTPELFLKSF